MGSRPQCHKPELVMDSKPSIKWRELPWIKKNKADVQRAPEKIDE